MTAMVVVVEVAPAVVGGRGGRQSTLQWQATAVGSRRRPVA